MVEDLAIIFKRVLLENGETEFIPIKVVEGYFDMDDKWFITSSGTGYHYISDIFDTGNVYALRKKISSLMSKNPNLTLKQIKEKMLELAKKFRYIRGNKTIESDISIINKETGKQEVLEEEDYELIDTKSEYDSETIYHFSEMFLDPPELVKGTDENIPSGKIIPSSSKLKTEFTPKELADEIKKYVIDQDKAVEEIATSIYMHHNFPPSGNIHLKKKNIITIGPTGTGKTYIFEVISKILEIPLVTIKMDGFSQAGYEGRSTNEIFQTIFNECNCDISAAESCIVLLDEIDKLAFSTKEDGSISTKGVQKELLGIVENETRTFKTSSQSSRATLNTKNMLFVGAGAWQSLYTTTNNSIGFMNSSTNPQKSQTINQEKIVKSGFMPELVGRFPVIVELNKLTKESLKRIILESKESELQEYIEALSTLGIKNVNIDAIIDLIAEDAIKKNIGARGLLTTMSNIFSRIFYDVASNKYHNCQLIIGQNILTNPNDYEIKPIGKVKARVN